MAVSNELPALNLGILKSLSVIALERCYTGIEKISLILHATSAVLAVAESPSHPQQRCPWCWETVRSLLMPSNGEVKDASNLVSNQAAEPRV